MLAIVWLPCPLFAVHCSLFTFRCLQFTAHLSLFTAQCLFLYVHCSIFTVHCSLFSVHRTLFSLHCFLFSPITEDNSFFLFQHFVFLSPLSVFFTLLALYPKEISLFASTRFQGCLSCFFLWKALIFCRQSTMFHENLFKFCFVESTGSKESSSVVLPVLFIASTFPVHKT